MQILYQPIFNFNNSNTNFKGKTEEFLRIYKQYKKNVPLNQTVMASIFNEQNFVGEGLSKKVYNIKGLKNYLVRVYKGFFKKEDLNLEFTKPKDKYMNDLEGVVLSIPGKIDIVKRKSGKSIGIDNYAKRIEGKEFPSLDNIIVTRDETLKSLNTYEKLQGFPIKSFEDAYKKMGKFCKKLNYQFDIISPNNILVDEKNKKINLIDPVTPQVNIPVHGNSTNFYTYHGCDSLYPVICDFVMQKEHFENLNQEEKARWMNAVNTIIKKCIEAGKNTGFTRNVNKMQILYSRISKFWKSDELLKRYNDFVELYSDSINHQKIIDTALNYRNKEQDRIDAIKKLDAADFKTLQPVFVKILEAPHQPKVEFPEIINAVLDRIEKFDKNAKPILPTLEELFDKEIFCTTKKRLYKLFISIEPSNKKFLEEIEKSSSNIFEKTLYEQEFKKLYENSDGLSNEYKKQIKKIYNNSQRGEKLTQDFADKLWISRTCTKTSDIQDLSIANVRNAYEYIESKKDKKITINDLINLHKLIFTGIKNKEFITGKLRTPDTDVLIQKIFNIKGTAPKMVNDYSESKDVVHDLNKLEEYIDNNFDTMETFKLASEIFSEIIRIHPFLDGNGRVTRLFVEQFLLSKGYRLNKWPEEILYRKIFTPEQFIELLRQNSVKIS